MITVNYKDKGILKKVSQAKRFGLYSFFRPIAHQSKGYVKLQNDSKRLVMLGSNNYLGLTEHPYVKEMAIRAIERYGTGCTGSRFLNGNYFIHEELEERLATFVGKERALIFSTGMQSNLGAISCLVGAEDAILSDKENHASIIDGINLSKSRLIIYRDIEDLDAILEKNRQRFEHMLLVTDGVFSMTGRYANLPYLCDICERYKIQLYVDDAHGIGVMGDKGKGLAHFFGVNDRVDFVMGTFSKSFASVGGFVAGDSSSIEYLKHTARSFMFSAAVSPSAAGTVLACLDLLENDPSILDSLWKNVNFFANGLKKLGYNTCNSETPIIPLMIGDETKTLQMIRWLEENGIFATAVLPPAVPRGAALIRTSLMASHQKEDLAYCLEVLERMRKVFDLDSVEDSCRTVERNFMSVESFKAVEGM